MHPKSPNPSYLVNVNLICCYMRVFCTQLPYDRPYKLACTSKCTITLIIFHDVLIQLKQKKETNNELTGATPSSSEIKYRWQRIIYSLNLKNKKLWAKQIFFLKVPKKQNTENDYITSIPLTLPSELLNSSPDSMTRIFDGPEISNNKHWPCNK